MHYFYVLYSLKDGRLYKGYSSNLIQRILQHGAGRNLSTKNRRPVAVAVRSVPVGRYDSYRVLHAFSFLYR